MKRSPLKRKPFLRKPPKQKSFKKPIKKKPLEESEWFQILNEYKLRFVEAGITSCELRLTGCTGAYNFGWSWGFAHSLKRGKIVSAKVDEDRHYLEMREFCYACGNCHGIIERRGNKNLGDGTKPMKDYVIEAIAKRKVQP